MPGHSLSRSGGPSAAPRKPNPWLWEQPRVREALRRHNFAAVFEWVYVSTGMTQREIGELVDMTQPQIAAIINNQRRVTCYDVIMRIVVGLGIPPGHAGVAWSDDKPPPTREAWIPRPPAAGR